MCNKEIKTEAKALNFKAQTPEFIANEILAKVEDIECLVITAKFKTGEVATLRSYQTPEQAAMLQFVGNFNTTHFIMEEDHE